MPKKPVILTTEEVAVASLQPYYKNPRRGNVAAIVDSLREHGQYRAIVVNKGTKTKRKMEVLVGNHTLAAARDLGLDTLSAHLVDVTDEEAAKIVAVDNRSHDLGFGYDEAALLDLLNGLPDLTGTGYEQGDLDALLDKLAAEDEDPTPALKRDPDGKREIEKFSPIEDYEAKSRRIVVLDYDLATYVWMQDHLGRLGISMELDSNAAVILRLVADAVNEEPPGA